MTVSPTERAQARVNAAQDALDRALATGADTTKPRETLDLAQDELARIQDAAQGQDAAKVAEDHRAQEAEARRLCESAKLDLSFALQDAGLVSPPEPSLPPSVALSLVAARAAQAEHRGLVRDHEGRLAALRARLTGLSETRSKTIARRAEGRLEPTDAPLLALLDADIEGLRGLIARTEQEGPGADAGRVAEWERQWDQAIARERGRILADIARQLDARLAAVLGLVKAGPGPWYKMSPALESAMRYL